LDERSAGERARDGAEDERRGEECARDSTRRDAGGGDDSCDVAGDAREERGEEGTRCVDG
jgi:hypothetical protein